jgi:hypothetical protein
MEYSKVAEKCALAVIDMPGAGHDLAAVETRGARWKLPWES